MSLSVNIQKRLGDFSLNVQFDTDRELLALLGASGSGKSLTLRCIAGLLTPDRGRILLNGRVLFDREAGINLPPRQRRVGFLFQNYALFPHMTVLQNLEAGLHRLPRPLRRQRALELLDRLRLTRLADAYPATLSGGEQQRTALARTLGAEPEVLLLDEPFSALDDHLKWEVELSLARTLEAYGGDVILVSHNRDEVCRLAKTVCVLDRGRSEPVVTVDRLMRSPGTRSAALLSGCKNLSPVTRLPGGDLLCRDWGWTLPPMAAPADLAWVGIRAHSLRPEPGELSLDCTVDRVIDNVFTHVVMLRTPGPGLLRLERPKGDWTPPPAGSPLTVSTAPDRILLLTGGEPHG